MRQLPSRRGSSPVHQEGAVVITPMCGLPGNQKYDLQELLPSPTNSRNLDEAIQSQVGHKARS